ncbi:membrane integrity-associated transporter subunit PqiC [Idiomarina piscisalsi]|uniref:PqiC family protein n=1 Tax=Idiomarina piscisalsi TaxID=1096243 RepID=UPI001383401C|nr:ABC-type transport auxiliary lipoprotein family protein [Idiomarina piscisalsi]MTJ01097.1 hypothetical protein [Idiomarina piscisalsi]
MKIKRILIGSVSSAVVFLAGCSSQSYNITQYRLPHLSQSVDAVCPASKRNVVVGEAASKMGIQIQQDETRWHTAKQHRWSTPLSNQLQRSIQHLMLNDDCSGFLTVMIDDFYGSYDSHAVVAGHWQYEMASSENTVRGTFTEKVPLKADGYPALVSALDEAWLHSMDTISLAVGSMSGD